MLPSSMAWQLFQQGVIDKAEFLGGGVSELANGSQTRDLRFRLRSVNIGGIKVRRSLRVQRAISSAEDRKKTLIPNYDATCFDYLP